MSRKAVFLLNTYIGEFFSSPGFPVPIKIPRESFFHIFYQGKKHYYLRPKEEISLRLMGFLHLPKILEGGIWHERIKKGGEAWTEVVKYRKKNKTYKELQKVRYFFCE